MSSAKDDSESLFKCGIFPCNIRLFRTDLWVGWVEPGEGKNFLWHIERRIFWSRSKIGLQQLFIDSGQPLQTDEFSFDVALVSHEIQQGRLDSPDQAIKCWNLFSDFSYTLSDTDPGPFAQDETDIYDKIFSLSDVASFLDMSPQNLDALDLVRLRSVFERGVKMILDCTLLSCN